FGDTNVRPGQFLTLGEIKTLFLNSHKVNRKGDEIAQMATEYTAAEIAFFKAIVRSTHVLKKFLPQSIATF
ncbi:hypothetical protein C0993_006278, partial [Termitomyces sp. T159_Od127]